jgi:hypothetical protein
MAALSTAQANAILDAILREVAYTPPDGLFLSLHSADPGVTGANELAAAEAYARVQIRPTGAGAGTMSAASARASSNSTDLVFPEAGGDGWAQATHFGIWDAASGGNYVIGGALTTPRTAGVGVAIRIPAGDLDVTIPS